MKAEVLNCEKIKEGYIIKLSDGNGSFYIDGKGGQLGDRGAIGESIVLDVYKRQTLQFVLQYFFLLQGQVIYLYQNIEILWFQYFFQILHLEWSKEQRFYILIKDTMVNYVLLYLELQ